MDSKVDDASIVTVGKQDALCHVYQELSIDPTIFTFKNASGPHRRTLKETDHLADGTLKKPSNPLLKKKTNKKERLDDLMITSSDVSPTLRMTQVAFAVFFCFTCAGVIFGFAALKPILIEEGVYSDLCDCEDNPLSNNQLPCKQQVNSLQFIILRY